MASSPGALMRMGIRPDPAGTLEELQEAGINPSDVGCCFPNRESKDPRKRSDVMGCSQWVRCPFDQVDMGGFKTKGPQNVPFRLITHENDVMQDYMPCFRFAGVLEMRRRQGIVDKMQGRTRFESIRVIGKQGDTIKRRSTVPIDPNDSAKGFKTVVEDIEVPKFPRPNELAGLSFEAEIMRLEQLAEAKVQVQVIDADLPPMPNIGDDDAPGFEIEEDENA